MAGNLVKTTDEVLTYGVIGYKCVSRAEPPPIIDPPVPPVPPPLPPIFNNPLPPGCGWNYYEVCSVPLENGVCPSYGQQVVSVLNCSPDSL